MVEVHSDGDEGSSTIAKRFTFGIGVKSDDND